MSIFFVLSFHSINTISSEVVLVLMNSKPRCTLTLYFSSVAEDELVVLQDKLLNETSETTLHDMSSQNSKIYQSCVTKIFLVRILSEP